MAVVVYILCALTSLLCAVLLLRGWSRTRVRMLLFSGICFAFLCLENTVLFLDRAVFPQIDLAIVRNGLGLLGPALLLFALVSEAE